MIESKETFLGRSISGDYPVLKRHNGTGDVVLFSGSKRGTIVFLDGDGFGDNILGIYRDDWLEDSFDKYTNEVTLKNTTV